MLQQTQDWASPVYRTGQVSELTLTCQRIVSHLMSILQVRNATAVLPPNSKWCAPLFKVLWRIPLMLFELDYWGGEGSTIL